MTNGERDLAARRLALVHRESLPAIERVVRVVSDREDEADEPLKLLEVNPDTVPSGILPIAFTPDPPELPYGSVVIEVTPKEYEELLSGRLKLPDGWSLGDDLTEATAA